METIKFIILFSIAQLLNVMLNTAKTIIMYDKNKLTSSLINAITYGFYTIVVVMIAGDMDLWLKVLLTAATNFVGVWVSMIILEKINKKISKDKLWEITITDTKFSPTVYNDISESGLSFNNTTIFNKDKTTGVVYHIYAYSKEQSAEAKKIIEKYQLKYIIHESELKL